MCSGASFSRVFARMIGGAFLSGSNMVSLVALSRLRILVGFARWFTVGLA